MKSCRKSEWRCANGLQCVDRFKLCDGEGDCTDNSDEEMETCSLCANQKHFFPCFLNGTCLPRYKYCDMVPDCPDGSDEFCDCTTTGKNFDCKEPVGNNNNLLELFVFFFLEICSVF